MKGANYGDDGFIAAIYRSDILHIAYRNPKLSIVLFLSLFNIYLLAQLSKNDYLERSKTSP